MGIKNFSRGIILLILQYYPSYFVDIFAPKSILPKRGFVRKNLLINKQIPIITKLVNMEITNMIVGEKLKLLTHEVELFTKK